MKISTLMRVAALAVGALCCGFSAAALAQAAVAPPVSGPTADSLTALAHPFFVFAAAGVCGILFHGCKKWMGGEIDGNLIDYFFRDHGRASLAMITSFLGTAGTMAYAHGLDGMSMTQLVWIGFTTGLGFDSTVNKATPKAAPTSAVGP